MKPAMSIALIALAATALLAGPQQGQPPVRLPSIQFPPPPSSGGPQGRGQSPFRQSPRFTPLDRAGALNLEPGQLPYDGRYVFARLRYQAAADLGGFGGRGGFGRRGGRSQGPPWSHDYPRAEVNFMKILKELTSIDPYVGPIGGAIVDIGSPDLFTYPISYMAEAGFWSQTDAEAANLRAYLLKGGFIIFDDFRGGDWDNFDAQMKRVLPDGRFVDLDLSHPVFHSFFDVATLEFKQYYDRGQPRFVGVFLDNDPGKRLLVLANFNNDVGEYWEFSDTGWTAIDLTNEAFKLGVNYIVYGLTH
jgi:hypothetical protein